MKKILILLLLFIPSLSFGSDLTTRVVKSIPSWNKEGRRNAKKFTPLFIKISKKLDLDPKLIISIAWTESNFNPKAISPVGAKGLMQVKDDTKKYILEKRKDYKKIIKKLKTDKVKNSELENMIAGAYYYKYLLDKFNGDNFKAVVAYNEGPTGTLNLKKRNFDLKKHSYLKKVFSKYKILWIK